MGTGWSQTGLYPLNDMKISLITSVPLIPPWDQGDKNLAYTLARAMPQHHFRVLTAQSEPSPKGSNLQPLPLYANTQPSLRQKAGVYWWFWRQKNEAWPDLYHFVYRPYALSSAMIRLVPAFGRRPTLHTVPAINAGKPLAQHLFFAQRVVALSRQGQRQLQSLGLDNVVYIPAAISARPWMLLNRCTERLKATLGVAGHPTVLFPGHYGPGYGADILLSALPHILHEVPQARFIFACRPRHPEDHQREQAVRQALAEANLLHAVRFYNTVFDMRSLIGAADLTVLPLETMRDKVDIPTTLLESLAAGRPIVISDLPPMNELVHDGGQHVGRLIPPGNAAALAEAVINLLLDHRLRCKMGRHSQSLMLDRHDVGVVAAQYEELYRQSVNR